jgi:hypothetical protein
MYLHVIVKMDDGEYNEIFAKVKPFLNNNLKIKKLHSLFDSLHDFGKFSTCYDTLCNVKGSVNLNERNVSKMVFSLLAKHCFDINNNDFSQNFSNLTTSVGGITSLLTSKDLENFFLKYAINKAINDDNNDIKNNIRKFTTNLLDEVGYARIISIFGEHYKGSNGCINLIVDTQKNVYKCIKIIPKEQENKIAVVIARESIYDPAPKLNSREPESIAFLKGKFYIETGVGYREYEEDETNLKIRMSNILNGPGITRDSINFQITNNSTYVNNDTNCILNYSAKHPNCITFVNKEINAFMNKPIIKSVINIEKKDLPKFYTTNNYNESINNFDDFPDLSGIIRGFAKKRYGDDKQKELVKNVNNGSTTLTCKKWIPNPNGIGGDFDETDTTIDKLILVTIDKMLFANCIMDRVPAIFDNGLYMYFYNPKIDFRTGVFSGGRKPVNPPKNLSFKPIYNYPKVTVGGSYKLRNTDGDSIELFDNPILFFEFIPFISFETSKDIYIKSNYNDIIQNIKNEKYLKTFLLNDNPVLSYNDISTDELDNYANKQWFIYFDNNFNIYIDGKKDKKKKVFKYGTGSKSYVDFDINVIESSINGNVDINKSKVLDFLTNNGLADSSDLSGVEFLNEGINDEITINYIESAPARWNVLLLVKDNLIFFILIIFALIILSTLSTNIFSKRKGGFDFKKIIKISNSTTIYSYLWLFRLYEMRICIDNEQLEMDFDDCNLNNSHTNYYVPTHKRLYILFDKLIEEYQKENFIGLLEKYLFEKDYELYDRIQEIKRFVLRDDNFYMDFEEFDKIKETPIYNKTYEYFDSLMVLVNDENEAIQQTMSTYYERNEYDELYKYCLDEVKYDRYTFNNMFNDFYEKIEPLFEKPINLKEILKELLQQINNSQNIKDNSILEQEQSRLVQPVFGGKRTRKHNKKISRKYKKNKNKNSRTMKKKIRSNN